MSAILEGEVLAPDEPKKKFGAPYGNKNNNKGLAWCKALKRALARSGGEFEIGLDKIADKVVEAALAGDKDAWTEIGNRLDGKPKESIDVNVGHYVATLPPVADNSEQWLLSHSPTEQ